MKLIRVLLLIIIIILVAAFTALNAQLVQVKYLVGTHSLPLAVVCFIAFVSGLLLGFLMMVGKVVSLKKQNFFLKHKIKNETISE